MVNLKMVSYVSILGHENAEKLTITQIYLNYQGMPE